MPTRLEQLQQMLMQEPNDEFLQYAITVEYFSAGEIQKAIEGLEKLLSNNKNYLAAYYQLGKCYEAKTENKKAIEIYKKGIEVALQQNKIKTLGELREALFLLED
jgi:tetratricopeptide (TPR) repeat protein